jgi:hypothetical protein
MDASSVYWRGASTEYGTITAGEPPSPCNVFVDGWLDGEGLSDPVEECNALQHMGHCPLNRFNVQNEKTGLRGRMIQV